MATQLLALWMARVLMVRPRAVKLRVMHLASQSMEVVLLRLEVVLPLQVVDMLQEAVLLQATGPIQKPALNLLQEAEPS